MCISRKIARDTTKNFYASDLNFYSTTKFQKMQISPQNDLRRMLVQFYLVCFFIQKMFWRQKNENKKPHFKKYHLLADGCIVYYRIMCM